MLMMRDVESLSQDLCMIGGGICKAFHNIGSYPR